ncbi:4Fe-4S ferredoxin iron-sulfur binding domain-containing protein [Candidatus Desulfarcum epimagneticum]|uniref:4Fe-4S ferredoxin iron-sulfur binding domain-containing protein n=1 Tax=uncultured Desulfobacteraceae bacterium TaxID=218296 RepID=A0A484HI16_9BACT|nr:4Fe-4S ferredoxin iron-sulfur binding domain-containing protein [uncultured Desulfobacteraceae bacterium]
MEGEPGNFTVSLTKTPRYIIEDKCTGCATCVEYCPVEYPDPFNQEISAAKAVHVYFSQAIPLVAYVDESCLYLKEKKCGICQNVCQADAIDFRQEPEKTDIHVGAVILSSGMKPFDPGVKNEYHYRKFPNVVASMDYERLLSATGPYGGKILRASDQAHPRKIAWIQCVGSRRSNPKNSEENSYCSGVCCTYSQKQAILTKDHNPDAECVIFHNDIRSHGKDFERYRERAEAAGVRFVRAYPSIDRESPESRNVILRYADPLEGVKEEEFDLVTLSVGLNPPEDREKLSKDFGIELNPHGFCEALPENPMKTGRPGVFVSGAFQGPLDIPESVFTASAAGSQCGELLDYRRGKLARERVYPPEKDVSLEEPKIGVFVCHCGANIGSVVDVPSTVEYTLALPHVVHAQEQLFSCATNSAQEITDMAKEKGLNRVVIAACSPRTLEPLFRDTLREAGLNPYYCEMANIREHCSWVHSKEKEEATEKAKDIIRMSAARARHLEPLMEFDLPVNKTALVVGGGVAGMTCALSIAAQGHEVHLVEKEKNLGGTARRIHSTLEGMDVQAYLKDLIRSVYENPRVHISHDAVIQDVSGYVGSFVTTVETEGRVKKIEHGAAVLAIGAREYRPSEYLYGQNDRVMTLLELEEKIAQKEERVTRAETLVMIQCVGCRNEDRGYCSRICCSHAVKNALKLKKINPDMDIHILFRDMRTYGLREDYYREASDKHVRFIRWDPADRPTAEAVTEGGKDMVRITVADPVLGQRLEIDADCLALAAAVLPPDDIGEMAGLFKAALSPDDFFKEAHVKLKPVEFAADGVYLCGMAHYPKHLSEAVSQAYGAAGRVLTLLSGDTVTASGAVCEVRENDCVSCGACVDVCSYGAIDFADTPKGKKARVNPILCKGDGLCNAKCPTSAIVLKHFTDQELLSQIDAAIEDPAGR